MKRIVFGLICCFFLALPAVCFGATGWYGSGNVGLAFVPDSDIDVNLVGIGSGSADLSYDTGFTVGGAVGYMMDNFRVEGEVSYLTADVDSISGEGGSLSVNGDVSALTFLLNGYLDFATEGPLVPYVVAGIGYSNVEADLEGGGDDDNLFTYELGLGVGYAISETTSLDLRYRYLGFEDYEYSEAGVGSLSIEVASHNITAGLRFAY